MLPDLSHRRTESNERQRVGAVFLAGLLSAFAAGAAARSVAVGLWSFLAVGFCLMAFDAILDKRLPKADNELPVTVIGRR
jgi:hypothetical protein